MPPKWEEAPIVERAEQRGDQPRPSQGPITVVPGSTNKGRKSAAEATEAEIDAAIKSGTVDELIRKATLDNNKALLDAIKTRQEIAEAEAGNRGLSPGQKKVDEAYATDFADWIAGGGSSVLDEQLAQLEDIRQRIVSGEYNVSGPVYGRIGKLGQQMIDSEGPQTKAEIERIIQQSLKLILGGQFAQREADQLFARAFDPEMDESYNARRLANVIAELKAKAQAKDAAAQYFTEKGTLKGYDIKSLPKNVHVPWKEEGEGRVRDASDGQVGGEDIRGYRYSPGTETEILQYVSGPHDAAGLAELYTNKALEEGIIQPDQAESYRQQAMLSAENFVAQTGGKGVKATGLDYSDVDKGATKGAGLGESLLQGAANLPESAAQLVQGLVALPADALLSVLSGERVGSIKSTTDLVGELAAQAGIGDAEPDTLRAVGDYLDSRWGGWDNIKSSLIKDPVGMAGDLSLVLTGGGSLAARGPGVVGSTGRAVATAGRAMDPLSAMTALGTEGVPAAVRAVRNDPNAAKAAEIVTSLPGLTERYLTGLSSGAGHRSLGTAFDVGRERGKAGRATPRSEGFVDNMRGDGDMESMIAQADDALKNMREEASNRYRSGMVDVSNDADILSFDDIDKSLNDLSKRAYYKGQVRDKRAAEAYTRIRDTVDEWRNLDPAQYHTAEGMDSLKQRVGDIAEDFATGNDRRAASIATGVYKSIKKTIQDQVPTYAETMKDYEKASETMSEVRKAFSLNNTAAADTKLRKLLSIGRNNVNTNFGYRDNLADLLDQYTAPGGESLVDNILAQNLSSVTPRGINKALAGGVASSGLGGAALSGLEGASSLLNPWNLAALPFMSPRLMGEAHYGAGRLAGTAERWGENVGEALSPYAGKALDFYRENQTPFLGAAQFGSGMEGVDELLNRYSDANPDVPEGGQSLADLSSQYAPAGEAGPAPAQPVQEVVIGGQVYLLDTETQQLLDPATGRPIPMGAENAGAQ